MMSRISKWLAVVLVFALLAGCGDASNYIKENYSLIDVQGQGKSTAKIYSVEGKNVPTVAKELADQEPPLEISKEDENQMFLVYDNKIINIQKDKENENTTLVQLDSIEYAKEHYDSSFLQGYVAASCCSRCLAPSGPAIAAAIEATRLPNGTRITASTKALPPLLQPPHLRPVSVKAPLPPRRPNRCQEAASRSDVMTVQRKIIKRLPASPVRNQVQASAPVPLREDSRNGNQSKGLSHK